MNWNTIKWEHKWGEQVREIQICILKEPQIHIMTFYRVSILPFAKWNVFFKVSLVPTLTTQENKRDESFKPSLSSLWFQNQHLYLSPKLKPQNLVSINSEPYWPNLQSQTLQNQPSHVVHQHYYDAEWKQRQSKLILAMLPVNLNTIIYCTSLSSKLIVKEWRLTS